MSNITLRSVDDGFGPFHEYSGRTDFDFTLFFEDTILSILPSALFLVVAPIRIIQLWREHRKVAVNQMRNNKLILLAVFVVVQFASLLVWCLDAGIKSRASIAASALSLAAALAVYALSYLEHSRSIRPSSIISAYLLLTVFMDAAKVRTLWLRGGSASVAGVASAVLAIKLIVLMLEAREKRAILLSPYSELPPEATSGIYSQSLFWWLNPMFLLGYKNIIREIDLFSTDDDLLSETLRRKFQHLWDKRSNPARRYELHFAIARSVLKSFAAGVFPRLCYTFFRFMQPFLIRRVTKFISQPESQYFTNQGWGLTAAYGLVYLGIAVSSARYNHNAFRLATMVRGSLVTAIYSKTMDLSLTALDENAAVTLMSTDVQRICDAVPLIHELWGCPIDLALAVWLLYSEVGLAMLGPLTLCILVFISTFAISARNGTAQKLWNASIQTRIDVTAKFLQSMKGVKMLGLTDTLCSIIQRLRKDEITESLGVRRLFAFSLVFGNSTDVFAPGVTFAIFVITAIYNGQTLDVSSAYTALSLISLLASPIAVLSFTIPPYAAAVGCLDRIQDYLLLSSRRDHRLLVSASYGPTHREVQGSQDHDSSVGQEGIQLREIVRLKPAARASNPGEGLLRAVNLTLAWNDTDRPVINDVSFEVGPGITMLVGPVGSGKSSLLKGLLGEIPSNKGYIYTDSLQIAFVGQTPWIQNGTLRDNIVGVSTFEHQFYSNVVHACALEQDFEALAHGDRTIAGSTGAGLSGGQKLRIALARAVYSRRHILILDDVFSGLDASSEERIFSRLLGRQGLLRDMDTSVLLVTHAAHRLSYADKIIALDSTGSITQQGSFAELIKTRGYVAGLAARHTEEAEDKAREVAELTKNEALDVSAQATAAEDLNRAVGEFAVYKYYFAAAGYGKTALMFALLAGYSFFLLFPNLWVKFWANAVEADGNSVNGRYLAVYISLQVVAWITLIWVSFHTFTNLIPKSAQQLHESLLSTIRNAPLSFFTSTDVGQVINRFSQDLSVIDFELPMSLLEVLVSSFLATLQAIFICFSAAYFAAIVPAVLGLMYLVQKFYLRTSRQIRLMDLEAKAPLYSNFIESLNGLATIRAFGWATDFENQNLRLLDRSQRPFYLLFCIQRWLNLVLDLTVGGLAVFLMILVVTLRSKLDPGFVGLALLNVMTFNLSLKSVIQHWTMLETALGAISRIKTFVLETRYEHLPQEIGSVPDAWPSKGMITLKGISASYTPDGPLVLKQINLTIPAGQKIGLVGRSGSGKSSFVTMLVHMLEIREGITTIDEIDLATIPREQVRQRLNIITQDPLFIAGTVRANLDPLALSQSDGPLISVLIGVGLWDIVSNAGGLDIAMEPENLLSHGQRQLFCLARAIVNKSHSKILILDEATASVDLQTDETMQRIIREEFQECTIIAVAHRLGTIIDFDRVIVMDRGRIVEDGVPQKLLENRRSWFKKLWDS